MRCPRCGRENPRDAERCGACEVRFVRKRKSSAKNPAVAPSRPRASAAPKGGSPPAEKKHVIDRLDAPALELARDKTFTFGRDPKCSLPIRSSRVSRLHAEIRWTKGKFVLSDRGSANGTFVGGKPVIDHPLAPGDEITIGPFVGIYRVSEPGVAPIPPTALGGPTLIEKGDLVRGQIGPGGLVEVLQGIEFNKKTGTLFVFSLAGQGWITFKDGVPQAAESGVLADAEAIFSLLDLAEGRYSLTGELRIADKRMKTKVTALLLEYGRRKDESS
ncbi:MAG TPA: FHA domain-containing protein [Planctomycetota bacterium]|nr:FHA domain-containing protein [Planctomycetota bacterium]